MSKCIAVIAFALMFPFVAGLASANAQETTLLCRFSKFTVTESGATPGRMKTLREVQMAIPRSILVSVDDATGMVSSPQQNMQLQEAKFADGQISAHIQHVSDNSWLFGEETDGAPVLIVDPKNRIGSVMAQLKTDGMNKLALSAGLCRQFRMQTPDAPQVQAAVAP